MPGPNSPTPPVIDKQPLDIDLSNGVNEFYQQETVPWQKFLTKAENCITGHLGCIDKRPGTKYQLVDTSIQPIRRMLPLSKDLVVHGGSHRMLNSVGTGSAVQMTKSKAFELGLVSRMGLGSSNVDKYTVGGYASNATGACLFAGQTGNYTVSIWDISDGTGSPSPTWSIMVHDTRTGARLRSYTVTLTAGAVGSRCASACISGTVFHAVVCSNTAIPKHVSFDTASLPADGTVIAGTNVGGGWPGATVADFVGVTPVQSGGCVFVGSPHGSATMRMEGFSNLGVSVSTLSLPSFLPGGICSTPDGSTIVISGINNATSKIRIAALTHALGVLWGVTDPTNTGVAQGVRVSCDESLNCHVVSWDAAVVTASANAAKATVLYYPPATSSPTDLMVMYNWAEIAAPVYLPSTGRTYLAAMHRPDSTVGGSVATHTDVASYAAVLDITSYAKEGTAYSPGTYQEARPVAGIGYTQYSGFQDETTGMFIGTAVNRTSLVGQCNACVDGDDLVFASTTKVGPGSIAVEAIRLTPNDPWAMGSVSDGESVYGGVCGCIDANGFCEFGQIEAPSLYLTDGGAAGTSLNGAYNYIAVLELVDTFGNSHFSKCSLPSSFTVPNGHMVNVVSTSSFFTVGSARRLGDAGVSYAVLHVYRTQVGQTQYYLVCTLKALKSITSFSDTMSDTTLAAQPEPYRQPGTPGTALDRNPSLMAKHAVKHKDRLFYCNGSTVYYSSFQVGGEAYWFNPAFSFEVPGGTGDITALGSMDGVLVIFKADSVFVVDGDGPGENGGNGSEFTPPRQIMTEHGCTYARSLISTPVGLMFRSGIGIMLLDRSLQVQFLGKTVVDTCDAYPYDRGAVYDVDNRRALFLMADSVQANGLVARTANSVVVCYDIYSSSWSTWRIASNDGTVPAGGGGSYDPTVMALSGWWIDYAGPTWAGTASAGTSAAHDLADSANTAASGAALNGHGTIAYSGAQKTVSTYKLGDIFANTPGVGIDAGTITILFKANSAPAPDASPYNDPMLFGSYASGYLTIGFNSSGVYPSFFGGAYAPCAPIAAATGVWNCVQIRFNSTSTQYRVNGGAWTTAAAYALPATPAESVSIAVSDGQFGTNYFDGTIAAIMTNDTKLSDADCDNLLTYLSGRYLVSIGAPLVGPPTPDGYGFNDICLANVGGSRKVFLNNGYVPHYLDESDSSDVYFYNPYTIETGWIRLDSAQDRIRVSDFLMLAKSQSPHDLTISVAYDYSPTYSYSKTWTAAKIAGMTLEQLELQIPGEARQAVRFKIQDSANADSVTYPMGTSKGPRILALTAKVGRRGGGAKLPADNKG